MSVAATVYSYCIALFVPNMISTDPKVIGKFTVVSEFEYPHCGYAIQIAITEYPRSPSGWIRA